MLKHCIFFYLRKQVAAGVLLIIQSLINMHNAKDRNLGFTINHFIDAFIFLSVFCDIMKMNFGIDPVVPHSDDVKLLKP